MIPVSTRTTCLFIILLATIPLTGCNEVEMQSQWRTKPIAMDGSRAGWPEDVQYFDKDSKMHVSIMNDENNLYIRLLTRSETTKRMFLRAGFTIWIDDTGDTEKNFGVQFRLPDKAGCREPYRIINQEPVSKKILQTVSTTWPFSMDLEENGKRCRCPRLLKWAYMQDSACNKVT